MAYGNICRGHNMALELFVLSETQIILHIALYEDIEETSHRPPMARVMCASSKVCSKMKPFSRSWCIPWFSPLEIARHQLLPWLLALERECWISLDHAAVTAFLSICQVNTLIVVSYFAIVGWLSEINPVYA